MTTEEWFAAIQAELHNPATAEQARRALGDPNNAALFNEMLEKTRERSANAYNKRRADDLKHASARPNAAASAARAGASQSSSGTR